ncbi:hypothetical protein BpHYR1_025823 [Brachionus plicatilis]|uniref:Transmembrane protein n=1 Tax=Brachionus plicatilis TaxID=10195 RepID=A0A3M7SL06_BRAPC|nr:hypothetical protein BpHYR1_025823 [Brachionus plicatilis]
MVLQKVQYCTNLYKRIPSSAKTLQFSFLLFALSATITFLLSDRKCYQLIKSPVTVVESENKNRIRKKISRNKIKKLTIGFSRLMLQILKLIKTTTWLSHFINEIMNYD